MDCFRELGLRTGGVSRLQKHQAEIVVAFGKIWLAANEFAEDVCGGGLIVVLAEDEAKLDAGVSVFGIESDSFVQFGDGLIALAGLGESEAEIVVSFGEIGIGEDGLVKFFEGVLLVSLTPSEESKTRMNLRVVGLQL